MATNIKFHRITATSGSNINTETNYVKGDVYFIKSDTDNTGKVYICTVTGKGAAATLEDYSVDTNTWRPVENNLTSTSTDSSLSAAMGKTLNESITTLSNSLPDLSNAVQITWSELKSLRDAGNLVPGMQYRITDYQCTTTQTNTRSAGHVFDIIVTADDESTLNEVARAAKHNGDTYFTNNDLSAWQIWYCLDNDTTRFAWADSTNGKGVIYRMIDEFNNDVPYDFKNIQFKHPNDTTTYPYYYYTFASENVENNTDLSLSISNNVNSNKISPYINSKLMAINQILFIGQACYGNSFGSNCSDNTFSSNCYSNTFGSDCYGNTFGSNCYGNTFDSKCEYLHFGSDCSYNSFGSRCESNSFESNCSYNSFGSDLYRNSFGSNCIGNVVESNCYGNSFGADCSYNTLNPRCESNTFGKNCSCNSFDSFCSHNSFESDCSYNSLGSDCYGITFGPNSQSNTFGNDCKYINFASDEYATSKYNYYRNNHFGDGCQYIVFTGTETASGSAQVQNYKFAQGTCGTSSAYLTIDGVRNRAYETYISKDTDGKIKESVIAEKLDKIIEISYTELKSLRDAGNLVPGQQYRITDYDFTTTETDTDSAHKPFDIIVTADSESVLNENARAIHHQYEGVETYTGAIKLYKTDTEDADGQGYAAEVDYGDYFLLAGTVEVDGVTYYRYDKYELLNGVEENTGRYILLESIDLDSLNISLSNPLYPIGNGTYWEGEDGYTSHTEDGIVAYENGSITISPDPLINRDIASWELKYTLDNVKHSSTDGKGTILWMKDEFRNECNYDFINALFKVYEITACPKSSSLVGTYAIKMTNTKNITYGTNSRFVPTFGNKCYDNIIRFNGLAKIVFGKDCSNSTFGNDCHNNTFGDSCSYNSFDSDCHNNTFGSNCHNNTFGIVCRLNIFGNSCYNNSFDSDCYNNTFGDKCYSNTFGRNCYNNTFENDCDNNIFGDDCIGNIFGIVCRFNIFGTRCHDNLFRDYCYYNTFGNDCYSNNFGMDYSNTFGDKCYSNTFGSNCYNNTFGNECNNNTFENNCIGNTFEHNCINNTFERNCNGNTFSSGCNDNTFKYSCKNNIFDTNCYSNNFENNCIGNTFGNECNNNTFGIGCRFNIFNANCYSNIFGESCSRNYFGNNCFHIRFVTDTTASTAANYYRHNKIDSGVHLVNLYNRDTASEGNQVQNYHIVAGVFGISASDYVNVPATRNLAYETKVAKNSAGELKIYCEADLIQ